MARRTKIEHFSARRRRKQKTLRFSRRFKLKYTVSIASVEGASKNFRVFCKTAAHDVIFSNSRAGGQVRAPMTVATVYISMIPILGISGKLWWRSRGCRTAWSNFTHRRALHWLLRWWAWSLNRFQWSAALQHGRHVSQQGLWLPRRGDEGSRARCPRKFHADGDPCCCSRHRHQVTNFLTSSKFAKFCKYVVIRFVNR